MMYIVILNAVNRFGGGGDSPPILYDLIDAYTHPKRCLIRPRTKSVFRISSWVEGFMCLSRGHWLRSSRLSTTPNCLKL